VVGASPVRADQSDALRLVVACMSKQPPNGVRWRTRRRGQRDVCCHPDGWRAGTNDWHRQQCANL